MTDLQSLLAAAREYGELPKAEMYLTHAPVFRVGQEDYRPGEDAITELLSALVEQGALARLAAQYKWMLDEAGRDIGRRLADAEAEARKDGSCWNDARENALREAWKTFADVARRWEQR